MLVKKIAKILDSVDLGSVEDFGWGRSNERIKLERVKEDIHEKYEEVIYECRYKDDLSDCLRKFNLELFSYETTPEIVAIRVEAEVGKLSHIEDESEIYDTIREVFMGMAFISSGKLQLRSDWVSPGDEFIETLGLKVVKTLLEDFRDMQINLLYEGDED